MPALKTRKEVVSVLGFLGFHREFVPSNARLTEEMNSLRNKQQLAADDWTQEIEVCFQELKRIFLDQVGPVHHFPIPLG